MGYLYLIFCLSAFFGALTSVARLLRFEELPGYQRSEKLRVLGLGFRV